MSQPSDLRKSGIKMIGNVPWGTHFCQFYKTKKDLLDILIPYFKAGLKNNEYCMWITSEPLNVEKAKKRMRMAMPDFESYLNKRQIEIIPYTKWYLEDGSFDDQRVLAGWVGKLNNALRKGYDGLRLTDNTFWLERNGWKKFTEHEEEVNSIIGNYEMVALCTYSLDKCGANEIIDVISNHQFALIKHLGKWKLIESSERKKAEEELLKSQGWMNKTQEIAHLGSWELDLSNNHLSWSDEVYRIFGFKPQEFGATYESFLKVVHPDDRTAVDAAYSKSLRQKRDGYEIEHRIVKKSNGEIRLVHEKCQHIKDNSGRIIRSIGMVHDITERKEEEKRVEHFLGIAHHELKTPLTSIKGFGQLLKKRLKMESDEKKLFFISKIENQTDKLITLIDDLLNVTRIKAGKMEFMDSRFDLNKLVNEVIENLKPTTSHKIIKQGKASRIIYADPKYISRIISNMITNAIKYSPQVNKIIVRVFKDKCATTVSVQDFGQGIEKGKQQMIFEPYFRVETQKEDKVSGIGLGLYIAREIANNYKGKIWVNSKTGQGSTFYFKMPC